MASHIFESNYNGDYDKTVRKIKTYIDLSEEELNKNIPKWKENIRYYENKQNPRVDYTSGGILNELHLNNSPVFKDSFNTIFFQVNEIKPVIDRQLAEYTSVTKNSIVEALDPQYYKTALLIKKEIDYVERDTDMWNRVRIPCMKGSLQNGIRGSKIEFDPLYKYGKGKVLTRVIKEYNILLDVMSEDPYYEDSEYRIHIVRLTEDKAKMFLQKFKVDYKKLSYADDEPYLINGHRQKHYKLYFGQFKRPIQYNFEFKDEPMYFSDHDFDIFDFIYSDTAGLIYINKSPYSDFNVFLYINQRVESEVYPEGEIVNLRPLQDLYNVINTVILDSGRKANRDILLVDDETYNKRYELVTEVLAYGGIMPDKKGTIKRLESAGINKDMTYLLDKTAGYLQKAGYFHEALAGSLPHNEQLSGKAISLLQVQNRRVLTPKDISFSYTGVKETKYLYEVIAKNFLSSHYVQYNTGNKKYMTPVRKLFSLPQYKDFLKQVDLMSKDFESNNEVYYLTPEVPEVMTNPQKFLENTLVFINPLFPDADVIFNVSFDYNANRDKDYIKNMTFELMKSGILQPEDALPVLDFPNADVIIDKMKSNNKYKKLLDMFDANPGLFEQVIGMLAQAYQSQQQQKDIQIK
jgi:hypothetical protein